MFELLDDVNNIGRVDSEDMLSLISGFSRQCKHALEINKASNPGKEYTDKNYKNILFCGMGGSAIGAHIILCYLRKELKIPAFLNRDYTIPEFVNEDTLCLFNSYSGDTEEILSAYEKAKEKKAAIVAVSSNGKLAGKCIKDGIFYIKLPTGYPPRSALGYSFSSLLMMLSKLNIIEDKQDEILEISFLLNDLRNKKLGLEICSRDNPAKQAACKLHGKIPVIYGASDPLEAVVTRWKTQFAENSKNLSFANVLPEMNHNEIMGYRFPKNFHCNVVAVFLRDKSEHERVSKRIEITEKMLNDNGVETIQFYSSGKSLLPRLFSLIYTGDFISFYLAVLNKINPTSVEKIDYLKKELSEYK